MTRSAPSSMPILRAGLALRVSRSARLRGLAACPDQAGRCHGGADRHGWHVSLKIEVLLWDTSATFRRRPSRRKPARFWYACSQSRMPAWLTLFASAATRPCGSHRAADLWHGEPGDAYLYLPFQFTLPQDRTIPRRASKSSSTMSTMRLSAFSGPSTTRLISWWRLSSPARPIWSRRPCRACGSPTSATAPAPSPPRLWWTGL